EFLKSAEVAGIAGSLGGFGLSGFWLSGCALVEEQFPPPRPEGFDALGHHAVYGLRQFTDWLEEFGKRGYVGEVNWPNGLGQDFPDDQEKWDALGEMWYSRADDAKLWVSAWCADERQLYGGFWLSVYRSAGERGANGEYVRAMSVPEDQAPIVEAHPSTLGYRRGINVSCAEAWIRPEEAGTPYSNLNPGVHGEDYWYPGLSRDPDTGQNTFEHLSGRGIDIVRIPFRWERIQPRPGGSLDAYNLSLLKDCVASADDAGLEVVLDLHNYGGYWADVEGEVRKLKLGTPDLTAAHFRDVWSKISANFRNEARVVAYDLMNEPAGAGGIGAGDHDTEERQWENLCRDAVKAIRARGDDKLIMIPGYGGIGRWREAHPEPWIPDDPAGNHMYTAHQYFDAYRGPDTGGGKYRASYADDNELFASRGW
ncbi:MAG: glycoside hydrolase family 5 protein, partial [Rubrobacteraceae bacterium]